MKMPKRDIDNFVASKEKWITERLAKSQSYADQREAFSLGYGDTVAFRGAEYPLLAKDGKLAGFKFSPSAKAALEFALEPCANTKTCDHALHAVPYDGKLFFCRRI